MAEESLSHINPYEIPIYIISYNRPSDLKLCIERLEQDGYKNLIILDNDSTDESLLSYYRTLPYKIEYLRFNYGHKAFWKCGKFCDIIKKSYYVVTDPDIVPFGANSNYVEYFLQILKDYPHKTKVGFSLRIFDLPDEYPYKWDIIRFESFYNERVRGDKRVLYDAPIDTTFALYAPRENFPYDTEKFYDAIRTGEPYTARHLTWYVTPETVSKELTAYFQTGKKSNTSFNEDAICSYRREVISKVADKMNADLYEILKSICTKHYVRKHVSIKGLVKAFFFIFYRKFLYSIR